MYQYFRKCYSYVKHITKLQIKDTRHNIEIIEGLMKLIASHPIYADGLKLLNYHIIQNMHIVLGMKLL